MNLKCTQWIYVLLMLGCATVAQAQYAAKVSMQNGNSFVIKKLNIKGERLYSDDGKASTSVSLITAVEFRFSGINLSMCEKMFRSGDRKSLEGLLNQYVSPVVPYSYLPGNLGEYMVWMLRAEFWNGNQSAAVKTIEALREMDDPEWVKTANLYFVVLLLEQGNVADAKSLFEGVVDPEHFSVPMAEYIRAKLAIAVGEHRSAMQYIAQILAFHSDDAEWMAPATALELEVYQASGQLEKAQVVAQELMMAYPGTVWGKLGEKVMK